MYTQMSLLCFIECRANAGITSMMMLFVITNNNELNKYQLRSGIGFYLHVNLATSIEMAVTKKLLRSH